MVCAQCGKENEAQASACAFCGAALATAAQVHSPRVRRLAVSSAGLGTLALLGFALTIGFARWRPVVRKQTCLSNVRQITLAALMYA